MKKTQWSILMVVAGVVVAVVSWQLSGDGKKTVTKTDKKPKFTNALAKETSPYLLQHAHNPVDWMPWSDKAFEKAKKENKPIFLSVGYSTCHWCHVMAHEAFEDEEVAKVLNKHFVCIKVDREELPDVDAQYMLATQVFFQMQGIPRAGGWPNSVWLTPDRKPWYAGTYFPKPQFIKLLEHLNKIWHEQRKAVDQQANTMAQIIQRESGSPQQGGGQQDLNPAMLSNATRQLMGNYDQTNGGFGRAPKFPPHGTLSLLVRHYEKSKRLNELEVITHTLDAMRHGGVWDHVGGGFHRYSTDARWFLPHFEKMLYDNAQLVRAYSDGYRLTNQEDYKRVVAEIFGWLKREMTDPGGGFYSAQDADSPISHDSHETEEGKYYVWTPDQIRKILGQEDGDLFIKIYGIVEGGNFEDEAKRTKTGDSIPFLGAYLSDAAEEMKTTEQALRKRLEPMHEKLLAVRLKRPRPHLDDKVLASWNGLMIGALAYAGRHLKEKAYTEAAAQAADFILKNLRDKNGQLHRTWRKGKAKGAGYLTDHAYFTEALLELHETTGEKRWLDEAEAMAQKMIAEFSDIKQGGFYFTSDRHEKLLVRSKTAGGGGNMPDANGVAANALLALAVRTQKQTYGQLAAQTLHVHSGMMWRRPYQAEQLLLAADQLFTLTDAKKLPDLLKPATATDADAVAVEDPLKMELFLSYDQAKPGQKLHALVQIHVRAPYHIYAHQPGNDIVIPTSVKFDALGATPGKTVYPKGKSVFDKAVDGKVVMHEGTVSILVPLQIDAEAKGAVPLKFTIRAQPCDDQTCLMPIEKTLSFQIKISGDSNGQPRHTELFNKHMPQP